MGYVRLYVWVEGPDDERFFNSIIKPMLEKKYDWVNITGYATLPPAKVSKFIQSIKAMNDADYIFAADINQAPCVTAKKGEIQDKFSTIDEGRTIVVIREIESWYLAGLDNTDCLKLGVHPVGTTDSISKEQFNALIPKQFASRIDFMLEILKCFSMETAKRNNRSFEYFVKKYNC